jgi:putative transposase
VRIHSQKNQQKRGKGMPYSKLSKGRTSNPEQIYFITTVVKNRKRIFEDFRCARSLIKIAKELHHSKDVSSIAWVVMPDHFHWLFSLGYRKTLPEVMKALKAISAQRINALKASRDPVWQKSYYDHAIRSDEDIKRIARYVVANPLRAGLASEIGN